MNPDELQKLFDASLRQVIEERGISDAEVDALSGKMPDIVPGISDEIALILYKSLRKSSRSMLRERRRYLKAFEKRHYSLWKDGIDLLESFLIAAYELGENFNRHYRDEAAKNQDYIFEALTRLHARTIHVGFEVLSLLCSGFADGAHARWRTVHEIAVVSNYLAENDQRVARQYLEHEAIESYRAMRQFQDYAEQLGYEKYSEEEVADLKQVYEELCEMYGESFGTRYGWSAEALGKKRPTFADIEKASGLDHLRPYYKMASHNVHANPKGIKFCLGLSDGADILLAGPSNYGLADPAHGLAISILQATVPLLNLVINIDSVVMGKILTKYVDDIGEAFISIHRAMLKHDEAQQENAEES
jgi:hypothetical protein